MRRASILAVLACVMISGAGCEESECQDGQRICVGNLSRTCIYNKWVDVECRGNAPICDEKFGCMKVKTECGNGAIESGEECDGTALNGRTCRDVNSRLTGVPVCTKECRIDFSGCVLEVCELGELRCRESVVEICSKDTGGDMTYWREVMDCASSQQVCDELEKRCVAP
ncbi:MAG: hypothetical protein IJ165_05865 [Proteobacteria bacterium]|nr:hypothetical protein [Pseudomonadota bacterium]